MRCPLFCASRQRPQPSYSSSSSSSCPVDNIRLRVYNSLLHPQRRDGRKSGSITAVLRRALCVVAADRGDWEELLPFDSFFRSFKRPVKLLIGRASGLFNEFSNDLTSLASESQRTIAKRKLRNGDSDNCHSARCVKRIMQAVLTLGMLSLVQTPSCSKRSRISHAKMDGHSLL